MVEPPCSCFGSALKTRPTFGIIGDLREGAVLAWFLARVGRLKEALKGHETALIRKANALPSHEP